MLRYIWPALFFAASFYIKYYNDGHSDSQLILPFIDSIFPSLAGDPKAMGARSFQIALAISGGLLLWEILEHVRGRGGQDDSGSEEDSG